MLQIRAVRGSLLLVIALVPACVAGAEQRPSRGETQTPPPEPRQERTAGELLVNAPPPPHEPPRGAPPFADAAWVPGYWHWDGVRYVWVAGHWEKARPAWAPR